jgi:hypothetical protein
MRPHFPVLVISLFAAFFGPILADDETVPPDVQQKLHAIYKMADANLRQDSAIYRTTCPQIPNNPKYVVRWAPWEPTAYQVTLNSLPSVQVWGDGFRLRSVCNVPLWNSINDRKTIQHIPTLTAAQAIERAKAYLKNYNVSVPDNYELIKIRFDYDFMACWDVRWARATNHYQWDDVSSGDQENICVIFHEKEGLDVIDDETYSPSPKSLKVVMTREEAIVKASQCAPLVQRTPYYKKFHLEGFVVNGMKSCVLRVAIPNYRLDPKRGFWIADKPPDETRLCWVVDFTTIDSKADQRIYNGKLYKFKAPDIFVYLDAATGDCVGADFS